MGIRQPGQILGYGEDVELLLSRHTVRIRYGVIMLQKLSKVVVSSAQKASYNCAFEKCPLFPKLCHHLHSIMPILYHLIDVSASNRSLSIYLVVILEYFITM